MKKYLLIILILAINCSENGWDSGRKQELKNECVENAKNQFFDEKELYDICSCVSKKFINNFSWQEYQKMLDLKITNENSPELNNKLEIYISSVMKDCEIFF